MFGGFRFPLSTSVKSRGHEGTGRQQIQTAPCSAENSLGAAMQRTSLGECQGCLGCELHSGRAAKACLEPQHGLHADRDLDRTWPCRRTRWWALMKPVEYKIYSIPDFPEDSMLQMVGQLFPLWPRWDVTVEEDLQLTDYELEVMRDRRFGNDLRQLARDDVVPCFLHSYSTSLRGCPCGCRKAGFSHYRLVRDGVRGFYIVSMQTGRQRWLHPREAAILCGLDPQMQLPEDLRAGLCLVGQCASPLQSAWVGAHLIDAAHATSGTPQKALILY